MQSLDRRITQLRYGEYVLLMQTPLHGASNAAQFAQFKTVQRMRQVVGFQYHQAVRFLHVGGGFGQKMVGGNADALANRMASLNMATLPWAHVVRQIRRHMPRAQVVVWRHEDFATLWPRVLSVMSGPLDSVPSEGLLTFAANGLSAEGRVRLQRYCETNPQPTIGHLRRVVALFGTRYGKPPALPETGHLPAWVRAEFARLDQGYDTELDDIAGQSGVTVLHP